jgi:hypothetical protein
VHQSPSFSVAFRTRKDPVGRAKSLLMRFHKMTSGDALMIASTRDPYKTDDPAHLRYHKLNRKKGRMSGQVKIRSRFEKYIGR